MSRLKGSLWGFSDLASIIPKVFMPTLKDYGKGQMRGTMQKLLIPRI